MAIEIRDKGQKSEANKTMKQRQGGVTRVKHNNYRPNKTNPLKVEDKSTDRYLCISYDK